MPYLAGRNGVLEALKGGGRVRRILLATDAPETQLWVRELRAAAAAREVEVHGVARTRLDSLAPRHQGVVADVEAFAYVPFTGVVDLVRADPDRALVLAIDSLQDPQNLGSLLRTALAVGITAVVIPEHRSVSVTPAVVRTSAGAAEHVSVAQVPNLVRALRDLKAAGLWVVGLDAHGGEPYDDVDLRGGLALVVGSEGRGLGRLMKEECDLLVHLPMVGEVESLNAAIAGSIALYHVFRSRARRLT